MVHFGSNAKYTQFAVNGLNLAKPLMWLLSLGTLISHLTYEKAEIFREKIEKISQEFTDSGGLR